MPPKVKLSQWLFLLLRSFQTFPSMAKWALYGYRQGEGWGTMPARPWGLAQGKWVLFNKLTIKVCISSSWCCHLLLLQYLATPDAVFIFMQFQMQHTKRRPLKGNLSTATLVQLLVGNCHTSMAVLCSRGCSILGFHSQSISYEWIP